MHYIFMPHLEHLWVRNAGGPRKKVEQTRLAIDARENMYREKKIKNSVSRHHLI
jgi:hypothetical protein